MFLDLDQKDKSSSAAVDDSGAAITYGELCNFSLALMRSVNQRTLIFILSQNDIGSMAGYVASLSSGIVPLLLSCNIDRGMLLRLI